MSAVDIGSVVFVFEQFIDEINATSVCSLPQCEGKLFSISIKHVDLGGSATVQFSCLGCIQQILTFKFNRYFLFKTYCLQLSIASYIYRWWVYASTVQ